MIDRRKFLAAAGAGIYKDVHQAMKGMCGSGATIKPRKETARYHDTKLAIFRNMYDVQFIHRDVMSGF